MPPQYPDASDTRFRSHRVGRLRSGAGVGLMGGAMNVVYYAALSVLATGSTAWLLCEFWRNLVDQIWQDQASGGAASPNTLCRLMETFIEEGPDHAPSASSVGQRAGPRPQRSHPLLPPCPSLDRQSPPAFVNKRTPPATSGDPRTLRPLRYARRPPNEAWPHSGERRVCQPWRRKPVLARTSLAVSSSSR
jgi:hypothetical protein